MKFFERDNERIQILDGPVNVPVLINQLTNQLSTEEPFYVMDIGEIVRKHQNWIEKMPRVVPHYAVKCNDNDVVCATLAALGASFDCASKGEISKILGLGVSPDRIIFANPMKPNSHLRYADANNVKTMTFDSDTELHKIRKISPDAKLVLRIRCEAEKALCPLGKKFGCDPVEEAPRLIKIARSLDLELVGISFHVGSGCADFPIYYKAISYARDLFDYARTCGYEMNLLDVGGGFPGDKGTTIDEVAPIINSALDQFFPDKSIRVISEPGRYYVSAAFTLVTAVQSKRVCLDFQTGSIDRMMYYLNDGVYASFNCILYDHQVPKPMLLGQNNGKVYNSTVWGPTCDALDQLIENIRMPELQIDDWVLFENMGAYTIPVASPFNGFPLPKIYCYINKDTWEMLNDLCPITDGTFCNPSGNELMINYEDVACA
ncbi:ornithine decarboxylase 1-like [Topomyia yanbarensis]|uniref:ornithine decarboxylase 1-like n=1 Tax=Topomyia yanbarensis TaxID=2498891 RepID=UPI00273A974C|nr:ornithine decarboxylase 1-like [Topomyia yanbarensis]